MSTKRILIAVFFATATACSDSPLQPNSSEILAAPRYLLAPDPALVTFNSAACTLTNSATGAVSCSWDISNPAETHLNLWAEAVLRVSYDCVSTKNGRVTSSEQRDLQTMQQWYGLSAPSLTGSDTGLPPTFLPTDLAGKLKKQNACSGNNVPQSVTYSLAYWDVSVITVQNPLRMSCFASDNRNGCFTN